MQTGTLVSVEEYLSTDYSPDVDYVDGVLVERNVGQKDHSKLQAALIAFFFACREQFGINVFPEQRIQVSATHFRVPDICVTLGEPDEQVFVSPPFICIEILSPDDTVTGIQARLDDYLRMGVPNVWLLNPAVRRAWICEPGIMREVTDGFLRTQNPEIVVPLIQIFV